MSYHAYLFSEEGEAMKVYLSGEIHTDWRDQIVTAAARLPVTFASPVTDHAASDDCGVAAIRTRHGIEAADIVVVRFGEKYKQWNAAFDAGMAAALGKSLIVMHQAEHAHALKEVDAAALAVVQEPEQVVQILRYVLDGQLPS